MIGALDLRLRDFSLDPIMAASLGGERPQLRFEFTEHQASPPPPGSSQQAHELPEGSLRYFPDQDAVYGRVGAVVVDCRLDRGAATFSCPSFTGESLYLTVHPLVSICLVELLARQGLVSLHAACLAGPYGDGLLLAGPSGTGKSTLALALVRSGMDFLSDDIVFLADRPAPSPLTALGFPDAVGLTHRLAARFSDLHRLLTAPAPDGFPQRLRRIDDLFGSPAVPFCEPRALVFLEFLFDRPTELVPIPPDEALDKLVTDRLLLEGRATGHPSRAVAALLGQVNSYVLVSARNLDLAVTLVRSLV